MCCPWLLTCHWQRAGHVNSGIQRREWCQYVETGGSYKHYCGKNCTSCRCHTRHMERDSTQTATPTSFADNAAGYKVLLSAQWGGPHCPEKQKEGNADQRQIVNTANNYNTIYWRLIQTEQKSCHNLIHAAHCSSPKIIAIFLSSFIKLFSLFSFYLSTHHTIWRFNTCKLL